MNATRASNGLEPLRIDTHLQTAADWHASQIAGEQRLDHSSPDGSPFTARILAAGFHGRVVGENLAVGFSPAGVVRAWLNSPEHRRNLLSADFTVIGIGAARGMYHSRHAVYVTADMGG